jgi:hypothetical protein
MFRVGRFILLVVACLVVVALIEQFLMGHRSDPGTRLALTASRMDGIEAALRAHAAQHGSFPPAEQFPQGLGLSPAEVADPFSPAASPEPILYWSNGQWYTLSSLGPDTPRRVVLPRRDEPPTPNQIDAAMGRYFLPQMLIPRSPQELEALFASDEIYGDIRFRSAIYDPTNGLFSWGDIVRWGGPAGKR